ncbi:TPA: hypothetical protein ACWL66_001685 [Morganella morganii]
MSKVFKLQYYPLGLAAKHLSCEEIELLILAHSGDITLYQYPDPALLIGYEPVAEVEIGAMIVRQTKTGRAYQEYVSSFDTQLTDVVLPAEEMEKASHLLNMSDDERKAEKKEAPKSLNYLARFAKSLIQIHYGEDVANSIQSQLANPNSEINIDFKNKKLKAPDGKALANRLNAVDVEALDN